MTDRSAPDSTAPSGQIRVQLFVAACIVAVVGAVWLLQIMKSSNWPVVNATLSDVQTVACTRSCGGAKKLVYATIEFDRPAASGPARCRIENYNIARGGENLMAPATVQVAVRPDSCDDWRLVK